MHRKFIGPIAGIIVVAAAVPVLAATHGQGRGHQSQAAQHAVLPSQAHRTSGKAHAARSANASPSPHAHAASAKTTHKHAGPPSYVHKIHTLRAEIHTARRQYVAAVHTYLRALSAALASQKSTTTTALSQLKSINTTLAQAVKTEMSAHHASSAQTTSSTSTTVGQNQVVAKFSAELTALKSAVTEVQSLTTDLSTSSSPSSSSSVSPSPSPSTTSSANGG